MPTTQIRAAQIRDGAITNLQINASAAIATAKLAQGAEFLLRDGSVAMTGNLNMGSQRITNLGTPTASTDAATKAYTDTLVANLNQIFDSKPSARAATTANINISNPGTASFDGVTLTAGQLLLVKNQTTQAENGLYTFNGSASALTRIAEMDSWTEVPGALVAVEEGTVAADSVWLCTSNQGGTLGTTAITWTQINSAGGLNTSNFVYGEVPAGTINGSNTTFTLANSPIAGTVAVSLNGILQLVGSGNDYTISGSTVTFGTAPLAGDTLLVAYIK